MQTIPTAAEDTSARLSPMRPAADAQAAKASRRVEQLVRQRLAEASPLASCFREVTCEFADGVLTFHGHVPTDRVRSTLRMLVSDLREIVLIDNRVDVISSTGPGDVRPR